jgi:hypothetical protein
MEAYWRLPEEEAGPQNAAVQACWRGRPLSLQFRRAARGLRHAGTQVMEAYSLTAWACVDATAATGSDPVWPPRSSFPSTLIAASLVGR